MFVKRIPSRPADQNAPTPVAGYPALCARYGARAALAGLSLSVLAP